MTLQFTIEVLAKTHDRLAFGCGVEVLDRYLKEYVSQDVRRGVTSCYVARPTDGLRVVGYYTISMGDVPLADLPRDVARRLPRYPSVPVARIGRLAVDLTHRGKGLGGVLLMNAVTRAQRSEIAAYAAVVDAKDENAVAFYRKNGFIRFESVPQSLFFPLREFGRRLSKS